MNVSYDADVMRDDPRFKKLAHRLRINIFEVWGRLFPVWERAYRDRSSLMYPSDLDALAEMHGFADAMLFADLAVQVDGDDRVHICGVEKRIKFLLEQDRKRELANLAKAQKASNRGSKAKVPRDVPRDVPREATLSPGNSPGNSQGDVPRDVPSDLSLSGSGSSLPELPDPRSGRSGDHGSPAVPISAAARATARRKLHGESWSYAAKKHREARAAGVDPHARDCWGSMPDASSTESQALFTRIDELTNADRPDWDRAAEIIRNRVDVAFAEAKAKQQGLKYCTPMRMWHPDSFAIAKDLSPAQVAQPSRAPPSRAEQTPEEPLRFKTR